MKDLPFILFLVLNLISFSTKEIIINPDFNVDDNTINVSSSNGKEVLKSSIFNFNDSQSSLSITNIGFGGTSVQIDFENEIIPSIWLWSDYNQYDGKFETELEIDSYKIILNKTKISLGDTIMGNITAITKPSEYIRNNGNIELKGNFIGIVGKTILSKKGREKLIIDN